MLFRYELSNGQIFSEAGTLKEVGDEEKVPVIVVSGQYSFVGGDGITYWVNYTADENGFHPIVGKNTLIWMEKTRNIETPRENTNIYVHFVGTGPEGGIKPGQDAGIDPNTLKSLIG